MATKKRPATKKATKKATNPKRATFGKWIKAASVRVRKEGRKIVMDVKR